MKRSYLALTLLCTWHSTSVFSAMQLNAPIAHTIDGKFDLTRLMSFAHRIDDFIKHNYGKEGEVITLKDLIAHIAQDQTDSSKVNRFLKTCINDFVHMMKEDGYTRDLHAINPIFQELLEVWAKQRNKYKSPFYQFGKTFQQSTGVEYEKLSSIITSLSLYQQCLLDCKEFIGDVVASLPRSYTVYEQGSAIRGTRS